MLLTKRCQTHYETGTRYSTIRFCGDSQFRLGRKRSFPPQIPECFLHDLPYYQQLSLLKNMAIKKSELYSSLWKSCDELRGGMDASQYKDYVLVLLFVKYVSDRYAGQK